MTSLQNEVVRALNLPGWQDSIEGVKQVVRLGVERLDSRVRMTSTGYFNHSFIPDFILDWGDHKRELFLRLDGSGEFLQNDLEQADSDDSIFFRLLPTGQREDVQGVSLQEKAVRRQVLITEAAAVTALNDSPAQSFKSVLPTALLKGGRGVVHNETAHELSQKTSSLLSAAQNHESATITAAAPVLADYLNENELSKLTGFARFIWETVSDDASTFPLPAGMVDIEDDALRFVLDNGPENDAAFWRRVGRRVSLSQLVRVGEAPQRLEDFVHANLDRLQAQLVAVVQSNMELPNGEFQWSLANESLVLRTGNFRAYLTPDKKAYPLAGEGEAISLNELAARLNGRKLKRSSLLPTPVGA